MESAWRMVGSGFRALGGDHIQLALEEKMKISKLLVPVAAAALLALGGATFAQTAAKKPINTSTGAGAPMNFPTPMPNENGDYTQGGQAAPADAAAKPATKKTKVTKHKKKASTSS
jgi:hypothetical protein